MDCPFCKVRKEQILSDNEKFFSIFDVSPVSKGHALVISKKHVLSFFDLDVKDGEFLLDIIQKTKNILDERFRPRGFNIGVNDGKAAGQSVPHLHVHIIPRYGRERLEREYNI